MTTPQLVPTPDAAKLLAVSPYTLRQWRNRGTGPAFIRQGRKIQYDTRDLTDWFNQCRCNPANTGRETCAL